MVRLGYKHFISQLNKRFNCEMNYDEYVKTLVFLSNKGEKKSGKYVKYLQEDKVLVYYIGKQYKYPITIYPIDEYNKKRQYKSFNDLKVTEYGK